jgi:hypothetical protein
MKPTLTLRHRFAALILLLALAGTGCGVKKEPSSDEEANGGSGMADAVSAPLDYLGAQGRALKSAERMVSVMELAPVIQQFQALEDRFPSSLEELVQTGYLRAIPEPPPGQRFFYDARNGQLHLIPETPPSQSAPVPPGVPPR